MIISTRHRIKSIRRFWFIAMLWQRAFEGGPICPFCPEIWGELWHVVFSRHSGRIFCRKRRTRRVFLLCGSVCALLGGRTGWRISCISCIGRVSVRCVSGCVGWARPTWKTVGRSFPQGRRKVFRGQAFCSACWGTSEAWLAPVWVVWGTVGRPERESRGLCLWMGCTRRVGRCRRMGIGCTFAGTAALVSAAWMALVQLFACYTQQGCPTIGTCLVSPASPAVGTCLDHSCTLAVVALALDTLWSTLTAPLGGSCCHHIGRDFGGTAGFLGAAGCRTVVETSSYPDLAAATTDSAPSMLLVGLDCCCSSWTPLDSWSCDCQRWGTERHCLLNWPHRRRGVEQLSFPTSELHCRPRNLQSVKNNTHQLYSQNNFN